MDLERTWMTLIQMKRPYLERVSVSLKPRDLNLPLEENNYLAVKLANYKARVHPRF